MKAFLKEKFQLTDAGAVGVVKAVWSSVAFYIAYMLPMMLVMFFLKDRLEKQELTIPTLLLGIGLIAIILYVMTAMNYETTYNETYKEAANLRIEIADIFKKLPLAYFSKHDLSDLTQTIMEDVAAIEMALAHAIGIACGFLIFFILMGLLLLLGNVWLGICVLAPLVLAMLLIWISKKLQLSYSKKYYDQLRGLSEHFQSSIELSQEIQSFGQAEATITQVSQELEEAEKVHWLFEMAVSMPILLSGCVTKLSPALTALIGVKLLIQGDISIIYLIGYIIAAIKIAENVDGLLMYVEEIYYIDARVARIRDLKTTPIQEGEQVDFEHYDIQVDHVYFGYQDTPVLKDVTFTAKQNQITALIGPSGCGKSTLLKLISRLYDYDQGDIQIGGHHLNQVDTDCLFDKISIVFQDVVLFNMSILENIRIGNSQASDEAVKRAAEMAGCMEIIERLPNGFDTIIGENGAKLSGGERQRISIARALLKDAPIILLDEIAASLDVQNEVNIQKSLNQLIQNKTVLIISHRLRSVEKADQIVLLDQGKVVATGKHEDLLDQSALYRDMIEKSEATDHYLY